MNPEYLRDKILNSSEPFLIRNVLQWDILRWSLDDWEKILQNEEMEFRSGAFEFTKEPQWERRTKVVKGKFDLFLKQARSDTKNWLYFDYKYLNDNLLNATDLRNVITWSSLGFSEITVKDSTIWIGTKGAHTPCHIDTYGFNLVYQVYGRKLWILFPPEENLKPTRVPYEESSIFSELNFFSPNIEDFLDFTTPYMVTLEPGDVLYVPHGWWHYVENLETAISMNVWLPSPEDDSERIKEALVQFLVKQICAASKKTIQQAVLNPNMDVLLNEGSDSFLEIITKTMEIHENNRSKQTKKLKINSEERINYQKHMDEPTDSNCLIKVTKITRTEWMTFLNNQSNRFHSARKEGDKDLRSDTEKDINTVILLKAFTDPEVISLIQNKLSK